MFFVYFPHISIYTPLSIKGFIGNVHKNGFGCRKIKSQKERYTTDYAIEPNPRPKVVRTNISG